MSNDAWVSFIQNRVPHLVHILDRHGLVALMAHVIHCEIAAIHDAQRGVGYSPTSDMLSNYSGNIPFFTGTVPTPDVIEMHILCLQSDVEHVVLEDGTSLVGDLSSLTGSNHVE